jgi:hypothetical protein
VWESLPPWLKWIVGLLVSLLALVVVVAVDDFMSRAPMFFFCVIILFQASISLAAILHFRRDAMSLLDSASRDDEWASDGYSPVSRSESLLKDRHEKPYYYIWGLYLVLCVSVLNPLGTRSFDEYGERQSGLLMALKEEYFGWIWWDKNLGYGEFVFDGTMAEILFSLFSVLPLVVAVTSSWYCWSTRQVILERIRAKVGQKREI